MLDVQARNITDEMALAAADALACFARERGLEHGLLPTMAEWEAVPRVAVATAITAQKQGLATLHRSAEELLADARWRIGEARRATAVLMEQRVIPARPR